MLRPALWIVGLAVAAFTVFAVFVANDPASQAKTAARAAIDLCWSDQSRKSLSPGEQQFIAGTCERMAHDFETIYRTKP